MDKEAIKNVLLQSLSLKELYVFFYDKNCKIIAVDDMFSHMSSIEKHKVIYAPLTKYILNNKIHSVSIQAFTPKEWSIKRSELYSNK